MVTVQSGQLHAFEHESVYKCTLAVQEIGCSFRLILQQGLGFDAATKQLTHSQLTHFASSDRSTPLHRCIKLRCIRTQMQYLIITSHLQESLARFLRCLVPSAKVAENQIQTLALWSDQSHLVLQDERHHLRQLVAQSLLSSSRGPSAVHVCCTCGAVPW